MVPTSRAHGTTGAFSDVTELVPPHGDSCPTCAGSGVTVVASSAKTETRESCPTCSGYKYLPGAGEPVPMRTISWAFDGTHLADEFPTEKWFAEALWKKLNDSVWRILNPNHTVARLGSIIEALGARMKPTERIARIEEVVQREPLGPTRRIIEDSLKTYRGLAWKIKYPETEIHPEYQHGFPRHLLVRDGAKTYWVEYSEDPEKIRQQIDYYANLRTAK